MVTRARWLVGGAHFDVSASAAWAEVLDRCRDLCVGASGVAGDGAARSLRLGTAAPFSVELDGVLQTNADTLAGAVRNMFMMLNRLHTETALERGALVLHGGAWVVGPSSDSPAIVVIGESGSGKSTLLAAAALAGHRALAEEVVAIDDQGAIAPFHRPIGLRPPALDLLAPLGNFVDIGASEEWALVVPLPMSTVTRPATAATAAAVVIVRNSQMPVARLSPGTAVEQLGAHSVVDLGDGAGDAVASFRRLVRLVSRVPVFELPRRGRRPDELLAVVAEIVAGRVP